MTSGVPGGNSMLPFALAIFTGAFLLFLGQPLVGKYVLPWYGGGPGVWTACLLFFQAMLLAGYAYAHVLSSRLAPRAQVAVHALVLVAALGFLPLAPGEAWRPRPGDDPVRSILLLLGATIGLPYVALSATGPLLQRWFSLVRPGSSPYRLYALSNAGSLVALVGYPFVVEPRVSRATAALAWSAGVGLFALLVAACAVPVWRRARRPAAGDDGGDATAAGVEERPGDGILWVLLPAIASVLLGATTTRLCQDVAAMPLLWVLPLAVYLATFIVCFDHAAWYRRAPMAFLAALGVVASWQVLASGNAVPLRMQLPIHLATLAAACMVCHGELYRLRPRVERLTAYYLSLAAGGALGGLAVAVVAPLVFDDDHELPAGLWMTVVALGILSFRHRSRAIPLAVGLGTIVGVALLPWLRSQCNGGATMAVEAARFLPVVAPWVGGFAILFVACMSDPWRRRIGGPWRPAAGGFVMLLAGAAGGAFAALADDGRDRVVERSRNFYGTLEVLEPTSDGTREPYRLLVHGATTHGLQLLDPGRTHVPTTYYAASSGVGRAIDSFDDGALRPEPRRLGLVGLGVGTIAAYARRGDSLCIYEINPAIRDLADRRFTFLADCAADVEVVMGDARLSLERELSAGSPRRFDVLALDAFSSDAIPVHLLTREAFVAYLSHLDADGILAVHISNRYIDLAPAVERLADHFRLAAVSVSDGGGDDDEWWVYSSTWVLLSRDPRVLERAAIAAASEPCGKGWGCPLWTDDFASVWPLVID